MDDIYLSNQRAVSMKNMVKSKKNNKKRSFLKYVWDLLVKSIIVGMVLAIDFILFTRADGYNIFVYSTFITMEATYVYIGIFALALGAVFLLSFSVLLQNLLIGSTCALLIFALFNQFAIFDYSSFLANVSFLESVPGVENYSHLMVAAIVGLVMFLAMTLSNRKVQFYFALILILINAGLISHAYYSPSARFVQNKESLKEISSHPHGQNFVYIALKEAPSYIKFKSSHDGDANYDINQAENNLLGFYRTNGFTYYPFTYVTEGDNPYINMIHNFNFSSNEAVDKQLLSNVYIYKYFDFEKLSEDKLYLKQNDLFKFFGEKEFNIRVYQNNDVELCKINNKLSVNRCYEQKKLSVSRMSDNFSDIQKTVLLVSQWLESSGLVEDFSPLFKVIKTVYSDFNVNFISPKEFKIFNAFNILDVVERDIQQDKGNNAYFVVMDAPGNLEVYDSFCNLKPMAQWVDLRDDKVSLLRKQQSLAEQTSCLYGKLESFVQNLQRNNLMNKTKIVIQNLNVPLDKEILVDKSLFNSLVNAKFVGTAIFDPLSEGAKIDYTITSGREILSSKLMLQTAKEFEGMALTDNLKYNMKKVIKDHKISNATINNAVKEFDIWYNMWANHNQIVNFKNKMPEVLPLDEDSEDKSSVDTEVDDAKEIKEVAVTDTIVEQEPEAEIIPLAKMEDIFDESEKNADIFEEMRPINDDNSNLADIDELSAQPVENEEKIVPLEKNSEEENDNFFAKVKNAVKKQVADKTKSEEVKKVQGNDAKKSKPKAEIIKKATNSVSDENSNNIVIDIQHDDIVNPQYKIKYVGKDKFDKPELLKRQFHEKNKLDAPINLFRNDAK